MATEAEATAIKKLHSWKLLQQPGVSGVGVERDEEGNFFIAIHVSADDTAAESALPKQLDGCPTRLIRSGPFRKFS